MATLPIACPTTIALTIVHGADPSVVLSTMLWRMKDRFIWIHGRGYWFTGRPVPKIEDEADADAKSENSVVE